MVEADIIAAPTIGGGAHMSRIRLTIILAVAVIAVFGATPVAAAEPDPILLVHGYRGNPATWADMIARFKAKGRTAVAIDLASENNVTNATAIGAFIAKRGWKRVDIVAQSMGGLSARWFIKFDWSSAIVDSYASLVWRADVPGERLPARSQRWRRHARAHRLDDDLQHRRRVRPELVVSPRRGCVLRPRDGRPPQRHGQRRRHLRPRARGRRRDLHGHVQVAAQRRLQNASDSPYR
jgi:pimeloyl-ACP methyl ester carboxylesterase